MSEELKRAIRELHGCGSEFLGAEEVTETFRGETAWEGEVSIFSLAGHPTAERCYAWAYEADDGSRRVVAVLHEPPVTSPLAAVKAAIASGK